MGPHIGYCLIPASSPTSPLPATIAYSEGLGVVVIPRQPTGTKRAPQRLE